MTYHYGIYQATSQQEEVSPSDETKVIWLSHRSRLQCDTVVGCDWHHSKARGGLSFLPFRSPCIHVHDSIPASLFRGTSFVGSNLHSPLVGYRFKLMILMQSRRPNASSFRGRITFQHWDVSYRSVYRSSSLFFSDLTSNGNREAFPSAANIWRKNEICSLIRLSLGTMH